MAYYYKGIKLAEVKEDKEILENCLQGNGEEFRMIVDRYKAKVMAMALNILGNREDAEDVLQETFIQVFRNLEKFDLRKSFKAWLYTILYRRCLDQLKKRNRFHRMFQRIKSEHSVSFSQESFQPLEKQSLLQAILKHLSPRERAVLCLWANEGFSSSEISRVFGCSSSTARVYLFNARRKIKQFLERKNVSLKNH